MRIPNASWDQLEQLWQGSEPTKGDHFELQMARGSAAGGRAENDDDDDDDDDDGNRVVAPSNRALLLTLQPSGLHLTINKEFRDFVHGRAMFLQLEDGEGEGEGEDEQLWQEPAPIYRLPNLFIRLTLEWATSPRGNGNGLVSTESPAAAAGVISMDQARAVVRDEGTFGEELDRLILEQAFRLSREEHVRVVVGIRYGSPVGGQSYYFGSEFPSSEVLARAICMALDYPRVVAEQEEWRLVLLEEVEQKWSSGGAADTLKRNVEGTRKKVGGSGSRPLTPSTMWGRSILKGETGPAILYRHLDRMVPGLPRPLTISSMMKGQKHFSR